MSAEEVLAHSEDPGEWSDEPAQIGSRPSATQVVSARLPSALAEELLALAAASLLPRRCLSVRLWLRSCASLRLT